MVGCCDDVPVIAGLAVDETVENNDIWGFGVLGWGIRIGILKLVSQTGNREFFGNFNEIEDLIWLLWA